MIWYAGFLVALCQPSDLAQIDPALMYGLCGMARQAAYHGGVIWSSGGGSALQSLFARFGGGLYPPRYGGFD